MQHTKGCKDCERDMTQVNTPDGYIVIQDYPEGKYTLGICNTADKAAASIEVSQDNIIAIQAMLRGAST